MINVQRCAFDEAKSLAGTVDAIIVVLGLDATEGADRASLELGADSTLAPMRRLLKPLKGLCSPLFNGGMR